MSGPVIEEITGDEKDKRKSAATILVEMALEGYTFHVSKLGETFAIPRKGPKVVQLLRGSKRSLRAALAKTYFSALRKAAPQQALADAMMVLDGTAQEAEESELYLRVARRRGDLWIDLGDATGQAIRIGAGEWTVEAKSPVYFKRTTLMSSLPLPSTSGSLDELWAWLNVADDDKPLVAAFLVAALFHDIPHAVLAFLGEQGTGKSTALRLLVNTLDPSPVPARKPPRDADQWVTAAAGSWMVGLDNMSDVPDWLSDSLCRAVTGDGDVRRRLYTDQDHAVFSFRRCILLNSIDLGVVRGDLSERMLPIHLKPIPEDRRMLEEEIAPQWAEAHPRILGGLLDLAGAVNKIVSSVVLKNKPRMADFARILAGVDTVMGTSGLKHYIGKQSTMAVDALTGDAFLQAVMVVGQFRGTSAELLNTIRTPDKPPKGWPANARIVTQRLRRWAPVMRKAGIDITDDGGANHDGVCRWSIYPEIVSKLPPLDPHPREAHPIRGSAGQTGVKYGASQEAEPSVVVI